MRVAFIGLGVMGAPMAGHLAAAGHTVSVYNRSPEKSRLWAEQHPGTATTTPGEAAQDAELVALCVGKDDDVRIDDSRDVDACNRERARALLDECLRDRVALRGRFEDVAGLELLDDRGGSDRRRRPVER